MLPTADSIAPGVMPEMFGDLPITSVVLAMHKFRAMVRSIERGDPSAGATSEATNAAQLASEGNQPTKTEAQAISRAIREALLDLSQAVEWTLYRRLEGEGA